jgi:deoxyguanosine kinase
MQPTIFAVIGGSGIGKTFLVNKLANYFKIESIIEDVDNFPERIIENFTKDIRHLETILWFRNKAIKEMEYAIKVKSQNKSIILDTSLLSNELHITTLTKGFEQEILLKQAEMDNKFIPKPDITIFLSASKQKVKEFILKRNRSFDTTSKYMERIFSINKAHENYYNQNKENFVYINRNNLDFEKNEDLKLVINKLTR